MVEGTGCEATWFIVPFLQAHPVVVAGAASPTPSPNRWTLTVAETVGHPFLSMTTYSEMGAEPRSNPIAASARAASSLRRCWWHRLILLRETGGKPN